MPFQPMPIPKTKEEPVFFGEEKRTGSRQFKNIFEYFSKQALLTIKEASEFARNEEKAHLTPWQILNVLIKRKEFTSRIDAKTFSEITKGIQDTLVKEQKMSFNDQVFFSPETKKILFASYFISRQQSSNLVYDKHLLLALSVYPEMESLFSSLNLSSGDIANFYMPSSMSEYSTDLSGSSALLKKAYTEREGELENIMRILARENKHHTILLGNEGVGKSVIGGALPGFLASHKFPNFTDVRVISLDLGSLFPLSQPGSKDPQSIIEEVGSLGKIIFFLDNANLLSSEVQVSQLVAFLQNLEKRGSVYFILSVTPSFYKEHILINPYFSSFFELIKIEELNQDQTQKIIGGEAERIEKFYKVKIDKNVFGEVTFLSKRYLPGSLPQKTISLLEEVCASVSLKKGEKVSVEDVRQIVSQKTGIPLNSLTEPEAEKLKNLEALLEKHVIGQKEAITKVSESLRRARAGLKDPKKPIGSFLFLGPTGVGKTELAKTLAKLFFNDEMAFLRFDMSEYAESHTAQRLIGSPPGYVGYEEGGQLTNQVLEKPYSLILFDEIEKAHPRVFDLFLQILDDGRLTDSQGKTIDFRNTLIIFTSNIASQEIFSYGSKLMDPNFDKKEFFEKTIMPIVRGFFRPELINRFDDVIMFNLLGKKELLEIAKLKINEVKERIKAKNINFEISDEKLAKLVDSSYNPSFGARPLERAIKDQIENTVAKKIISGEVKEGDTIKW